MPKYNFAAAQVLRKKGWTNEECAKHFGYAGESGFRRRYKRDFEAWIKQNSTNDDPIVTPPAYDGSTMEIHQQYPDPTVLESYQYEGSTVLYPDRWNEYHQPGFKMPKWTTAGKLEPTGFVSNMPNWEWLNYYSNNMYYWDDPYIMELIENIWDVSREQILNLLPRGHGKTETTTGLMVRWIAEKRLPILAITGGRQLNRKMFNIIKRFLRNPRFRRDYGDIITTINQSDWFMEIHDDINITNTSEPAFTAVGRGGSVIGLHPSWVHLEDIIQEKFKSTESNESVKVWYDEVVEHLLSKEVGHITKFTANGTRKGIDDIYAYLLSIGWTANHYKGIEVLEGRLPDESDCEWDVQVDEYGTMTKKLVKIGANGLEETTLEGIGKYALLNKRMSLEKLLELCIRQYPAFMSQIQNQPISLKGRRFSVEWWHEVEPFKIPDDAIKITVTDSAYGTGEESDYNAIMTFAVWNGRMYVIDAYMKQEMGFFDIIGKIGEQAKKHRTLYNVVHADFMETWLAQVGKIIVPSVIPFKSTISKVIRIDATGTHYKEANVIFFKGLPFINVIKSQFLMFDGKKSDDEKKDDALDCIATALHYLSTYLMSSNDDILKYIEIS